MKETNFVTVIIFLFNLLSQIIMTQNTHTTTNFPNIFTNNRKQTQGNKVDQNTVPSFPSSTGNNTFTTSVPSQTGFVPPKMRSIVDWQNPFQIDKIIKKMGTKQYEPVSMKLLPDGKKKFINEKGEQTKIYPYFNRFFGMIYNPQDNLDKSITFPIQSPNKSNYANKGNQSSKRLTRSTPPPPSTTTTIEKFIYSAKDTKTK